MKAIFLKTFYSMKDSSIFLIIVSIFYYFNIKINIVNTDFSDLICILMLSFGAIAFFFQNEVLEIKNFNNFLLTSPIDRKTILKGKFLSNIIILLIIHIFIFLLSFLQKPYFKDLMDIKYNLLYLSFFSICICNFSISYLLFFILNKNLIAFSILGFLNIFISGAIISLTSFGLINLFSLIFKDDFNIYLLTGFSNLIISLLIMFISYKICLKKYNNTSF